MKTMTLITLILWVSNSWAGRPELPGTVPGLSISNSHIVTESGATKVIRGMAPRSVAQIQELKKLGVTEVLIFKNETKNEVQTEIAQLQKAGFAAEAITNVPFPWKDLPDFKSTCQMTIQALHVIEQAASHGRSIYFHCTVGEDRTGYLASLWELWSGARSSIQNSFQEQMCERGYEAGNPNKPYRDVVLKVREGLTPLYLKMLSVLANARNNGEELSASLCDNEPKLQFKPQDFYCKASK